MPVPSIMTDLSITAASNSPAGSETVGPNLDNYLRGIEAIIRREQAQGANVASAATVDLGAIADGSYVHITGTTTITSLGTVAAGIERIVVFDGSLVVTQNATSLILPDAANITTRAGDIAVFRSEGSGNWRCLEYLRVGQHGADIASAATVNLDTATGEVVDVTGTTTITAITLAEGRRRLVRFTGVLTLTHGASLVLPGSANIITAAGDYALFVGYASGVVRALYFRADGKPIGYSARFQVFTANGTFTVPANVTTIKVDAAAGGGGGGGSRTTSANNSGGAGGGGAGQILVDQTYAVTPGDAISITIGAGGTAGAIAGNGGNGGNTIIGSLATLTGGTGGTAGGVAGSTSSGGAGGAGSPPGSDGSESSNTAGVGNGGAGASTPYGGGGGSSRGTGGTAIIGKAAAGYGAGGGGAGGVSQNVTASGNTGGVGTQGYVSITW